MLFDSTNDKEALSKLVEGFKLLYPESKRVLGWRGDVIAIDWMYVMQECFTMARMRKIKGEKEVLLSDVLTKLGIEL